MSLVEDKKPIWEGSPLTLYRTTEVRRAVRHFAAFQIPRLGILCLSTRCACVVFSLPGSEKDWSFSTEPHLAAFSPVLMLCLESKSFHRSEKGGAKLWAFPSLALKRTIASSFSAPKGGKGTRRSLAVSLGKSGESRRHRSHCYPSLSFYSLSSKICLLLSSGLTLKTYKLLWAPSPAPNC